MEENLDFIINEIACLKKFNLKIFYNLVNKYGKKNVYNAFYVLLEKCTNKDEITTLFNKYFAAYLSIEISDKKLTEDNYFLLIDKYGEDNVNTFFKDLFRINGNDERIIEKFSIAYSNVQFDNNNSYEENNSYCPTNTVAAYFNDIEGTSLLKEDEEKEAFYLLRKAFNDISIAKIIDFSSVSFFDIERVLFSIRTLEQKRNLNIIKSALVEEDKIRAEEFLKLWKKKNGRSTENIILPKLDNDFNDDDIIDSDFLNEQLDSIILFIKTREKIITSNLRLVISIAKRYPKGGLGFDGLINEGNLGLMKAVEKFDNSKGYKFSTYATWWIRQSITRALGNDSRLIRIPIHYREKILKMQAAQRKLAQIYNREPTDGELASYLNVDINTIIDLKEIENLGNCGSIDTPIKNDDDSDPIGLFIPSNDKSLEEHCIELALKKDVEDTLQGKLTQREIEVIKYRFGLVDDRKKTLEEVGKMMGVTRERIRQIETKALRKLRRPHNNKLNGYK